MKARKTKAKYIDLTLKVKKSYEGKVYITRFMHLLSIIAPDRYELNNWNRMSSIEDKRTQMTVVNFSDNPFRF